MAADLEALYDHYRTRGMSEEEAARRAEEKLVASPEAVRTLVAVHTTAYRRFVSSAAGALRWGFNLLLFVVGVLPMLCMTAYIAAVQLREAGGALGFWPLLPIAAGMAGIALRKAHQLFVLRDVAPRRLHRGLPSLVFLAVLAPLTGGIVFTASLRDAALLSMRSGSIPMEAVQQIGRDATLLYLGLLLAIAGGLVWFVLVDRIAAVEQAESAALLASD